MIQQKFDSGAALIHDVPQRSASDRIVVRRSKIDWTPEAEALLGTATDAVIAAQVNMSRLSVRNRRAKLGIPHFQKSVLTWSPEMDALLGKISDSEIAWKLGGKAYQVQARRKELGIASVRRWHESLKKIIARAGSMPEPCEPPVAVTERRFLIDQLQFHVYGDAFLDSEDPELTSYLERVLAEKLSLSAEPFDCPHCHSNRTCLLQAPTANQPRPFFRCNDCELRFSRLTGTPLAGLHHLAIMPAFIRLLSQQIPYEEARKRLGVSHQAIAQWTKKFRLWLFRIDPSGKWEARVRLGIKPRPHIRCPRCDTDGEKRFSGVDRIDGRLLFCPACRCRFYVRDAERLAQKKVQMKIWYDPVKSNRECETRSVQ